MHLPLGIHNWAVVLQNPNNYVNIWEEWTIKEIQVYVYNFDLGSTELNEAEPEPCRTPEKILLTNNDAAVAEELSFFATNENYTISMYQKDSLYKDVLDREKTLIIRILFNESDTIAWDGIVKCYRNTETQERVVSIARSTYECANGKVLHLGSSATDVNVQDLPALEAFLLQAVDAYRVYINQTPPTDSTD